MRRPNIILLWLVLSPAPSLADDPARVNFGRDLLPLLSDTCFTCHGPDEKARKAKLRLDVKDDVGAFRGAMSVITSAKSAESELFRRVTSTDEAEMMPPPKSKKKLTPQQIELLKRWIDDGAAWSKHWAFEPPRRPELPAIKNKAQAKNPIDTFILQRLEREGLGLSPEAPREMLIRRVTLDLTGLPPTPAEVDAFLADRAADAYEKLVDRLLASPRYGERMAWDWLDAARYADSNGYQGDGERTMWPWRDWVVKAFNDNMPYDRFTTLQLAGDLLPKPTRDQKLATAFNRNHMINGEGGRIPEENRIDYLVDQTDTMATIWLGVTFGCARCHDHKYDPFTMKDYYRLLAYFNRTEVNGGGGSGKTKPVIDVLTPAQEKKQTELQRELESLTPEVRNAEEKLRDKGKEKEEQPPKLPKEIAATLRKSPAERTEPNLTELIKFFKDKEPEYVSLLQNFRKAKQARDGFVNSLPQVMVMEDMPKPRDTFMLVRGAYDKPADKVEPAVPQVLLPSADDAAPNRLTLARWLIDPKHPLTARVTVNRYWQMLFGTGLVKSVEEFGVQGEAPSHPELLDWLATEFMKPTPPANAGGSSASLPRKGGEPWDVKHIQRLLVTSATYRQSSKVSAPLLERDPENRLLGRGPRFRMPSWMIRDQALAASGLLTPTMSGPPVKPYQPPGIWEEATFGNKKYVQDQGEALYRRSLYVFWRRIVGPTMFFDTASRQFCTVKNVRTNTPLHALTTLNDTTFVEAARVLAQRVMEKDGLMTEDRIADAFRRVTARRPTTEEVAVLAKNLERMRAAFARDPKAAERLLGVGESVRNMRFDATEHASFTSLCLLILNLDETLTRQ